MRPQLVIFPIFFILCKVYSQSASYAEKATNFINTYQYDSAVYYFTKSIETGASLPIREQAVFYNNRGYAYLKLNEDELAIVDFHKSLRLYQVNPLVYKNLSLYHFKLNQFEEGCDMLKYALYYDYKKNFRLELEKLQKEFCEQQ